MTMYVCSHLDVQVENVDDAREMRHQNVVVGIWWLCPACRGWHFQRLNGYEGEGQGMEGLPCEDTPTRLPA